MKYSCEKEFTLSYTGLDNNAELNTLYAIELAQNLMTEYFGNFKSDNLRIKKQNNALWVLSKTKVRFFNKAVWLDKLFARGYTIKNTALRTYIESVFRNQDNKLIFVALQENAVIDIETRKVRKISSISYPNDMEYEKPEKELTFEKLTSDFSEDDFIYNQKIFYTDIDFSNHTNNAVYIRHIINTYPSKFFSEHIVEDFEIHYLHETKESELLSIYKKEYDNNVEFLIKSGDSEVVRAKLSFKDK
ncbi:MAG: hypothetical protein J6Z11_08730 [Candidatus Riflebacteria bacterium]|nr:hypothetical protein [Candidatus Riflebacteria bacterium]